jgi:hypothetical protein
MSWILSPVGAISSINNIGDVIITTPSTNEVLTYNGTNWVNSAAAAEVNDLSATVTWANIPDANVPESAVTQHEAALALTEAQIETALSAITAFAVNNYVFNVNQTVGAGQDNYVLTYDDASGEIGLEAAAAAGLSDIVDDTSPQLGGSLDVNGQSIVSVSAGDIVIAPDTTGQVKFEGGSGGGILIRESAAAGLDPAAYGQFWVKSGTFNKPWYTDDLGNDSQIAQLGWAETVIGTWTFSNDKTQMEKLYLVEAAAAGGDTATEGQLWVKNDAPNNLYFTDDTGQDVQITIDGSLNADPRSRSISATETTATTDYGIIIALTGGVAQELTLDSDPPANSVVMVDNRSGSSWTIATATASNLIWAKDATTGDRTLADDGLAVCVHRGSGVWIINGSDLLT